jgi:hypothetical protein
MWFGSRFGCLKPFPSCHGEFDRRVGRGAQETENRGLAVGRFYALDVSAFFERNNRLSRISKVLIAIRAEKRAMNLPQASEF